MKQLVEHSHGLMHVSANTSRTICTYTETDSCETQADACSNDDEVSFIMQDLYISDRIDTAYTTS